MYHIEFVFINGHPLETVRDTISAAGLDTESWVSFYLGQFSLLINQLEDIVYEFSWYQINTF